MSKLDYFCAARYGAVKEIELQYLADHWDDLKDSSGFRQAMIDVAMGVYPHAGELLAEVFQRVGNKTDKKT